MLAVSANSLLFQKKISNKPFVALLGNVFAPVRKEVATREVILAGLRGRRLLDGMVPAGRRDVSCVYRHGCGYWKFDFHPNIASCMGSCRPIEYVDGMCGCWLPGYWLPLITFKFCFALLLPRMVAQLCFPVLLSSFASQFRFPVSLPGLLSNIASQCPKALFGVYAGIIFYILLLFATGTSTRTSTSTSASTSASTVVTSTSTDQVMI